MNKPVSLLLAWAVALPLVVLSCGPKVDPTVSESLTVSPESVSFGAEDASVQFVYVTTEGEWTASLSASWMHLEKSTGSGKGVLALTADANTGEDRSGTLTVKAGTRSAAVAVTQKGKNIVSIVPVADAFDGTKRASTTYQLLIYSFADSDGDGIGDFKGIQDKLDYLDGLGATALWLSPAHPTGSYHAYDVNDYAALNPLYGTEQDFRNLIGAAHAKGIKIYMDFVLNHSGRGNAWFQSVLADPENSPYKDYYVLSRNPSADEAAGAVDNYGGARSPGMGGWHAIAGGKAGYTGRLHFVLDSKARTILVTETSASADTPPSTSDWYIYCNSFKGMKKTGDSTYEITLDIDTDWGFLVCSKTDWSSGSKYGASSSAGPITFGTPFSLYTNASNDAVGNITFGGFSTNYFAAFDTSMPDLNYGKYTECENSGAFKATVEAATKWVNLGVDGFRLDAVLWIYQAQVAANQRFLDQWYKAVNAAYHAAGHSDDIFMVGEAWEGHNTEKQYYKGLTSCFEFEYFGLLTRAVGGNASNYVSTVNGYLSDHIAQRSDAVTSLFMTNHDQDRAAESLGRNLAKEKQAAAMLLTTPGKPFIYQGEELGYYGKKDGGDEYVRTPVLWDKAGSQCAKRGVNNKVDNAMLKSEISVEAQEADAGSLLNVYKTWSRLRNTYPALADGTMTDAALGGGNAIGAWYMTAADGSRMLVVHNTSTQEKSVTVKDDMSRPVALLGSASRDHDTLTLAGQSSVVFQL